MIGVHNRVDPHGFVYNAAAASWVPNHSCGLALEATTAQLGTRGETDACFEELDFYTVSASGPRDPQSHKQSGRLHS
jgi:hypothetical protein